MAPACLERTFLQPRLIFPRGPGYVSSQLRRRQAGRQAGILDKQQVKESIARVPVPNPAFCYPNLHPAHSLFQKPQFYHVRALSSRRLTSIPGLLMPGATHFQYAPGRKMTSALRPVLGTATASLHLVHPSASRFSHLVISNLVNSAPRDEATMALLLSCGPVPYLLMTTSPAVIQHHMLSTG